MPQVVVGFQSTLPARGATKVCPIDLDAEEFQSTLPARGATPAPALPLLLPFQSTLPARGATEVRLLPVPMSIFQSTLPARGATSAVVRGVIAVAISIHAPRTGSDRGDGAGGQARRNFNPRSPHGERRQLATELGNVEAISIHAPRTGSDGLISPVKILFVISIHAPRTGSD